jgi:hypothetical protein
MCTLCVLYAVCMCDSGTVSAWFNLQIMMHKQPRPSSMFQNSLVIRQCVVYLVGVLLLRGHIVQVGLAEQVAVSERRLDYQTHVLHNNSTHRVGRSSGTSCGERYIFSYNVVSLSKLTL